MRLIPTTILAVACASAPAAADVSARYEMADDDVPLDMEMTFEVSDEGYVRMQMANLPAYYLLRDDELYSVSNSHMGPLVVRVSDQMALQSEFAEQMFDDSAPEDFEFPDWSFAAMGEEEVNGRDGIAYGIVTEEGDEPVYALMVIGDQAELAPLGVAMQRTSEVMARGVPTAFAALARANAEMQEVIATGAPLRVSSLVLTDVSTDDIAEDRFNLPAEPLTMEQLRAQLVPFDPPPTLPPRVD